MHCMHNNRREGGGVSKKNGVGPGVVCGKNKNEWGLVQKSYISNTFIRHLTRIFVFVGFEAKITTSKQELDSVMLPKFIH